MGQPSGSHIYNSNWPSEATQVRAGSVGSILDAWVSPTFQTPPPLWRRNETEGIGPATASSR